MIIKKETERLAELDNYHILNTLPEAEYDYIVELAATICNVPIALINFVGEDDIWFKAKCGLPDDMEGVPREISFCDHLVKTPCQVLQIKDTHKDDRFVDNPLVTGEPNIRFYAGSPLVTPSGKIIGAICVLDNKPRELSAEQTKALLTLANKAMENLESKRTILKNKLERDNIERLLTKVSDTAPGAIYEFLIKPTGEMSFNFISSGVSKLHPNLTAEKLIADSSLWFQLIHPRDRDRMKKSIANSYKHLNKWEEDFRLKSDNKDEIWLRTVATPERRKNGDVIWYGTFQDICGIKQFTAKIELQNQILSDIAWEQSHLVRAPLSRIMALVNTISTFEMDEVNKELLNHVDRSANELDGIIRGIVEKSVLLKTA